MTTKVHEELPSVRSLDCGCSTAYYVRGHVDPKTMRAAVGRHSEDEIEPRDWDVYYSWVRCVPDSTGDFAFMVIDGRPGARGCFPATLCEPKGFRSYQTWSRVAADE